MRKQRNRYFPAKAMVVWHRLDDTGYVCLIKGYLEEAGNFRDIRGLDRSPRRPFLDPL